MNILDKIEFKVLLLKRYEIKYFKMMYFIIKREQSMLFSALLATC